MTQARENETEAAREARLAHKRDHAAEVWLFVVLIGDQLVINPPVVQGSGVRPREGSSACSGS